jgi:hypothetical protein
MQNQKNRTGYLGNSLLKRKNTKHQFTKEQVTEYLKCSNDPIYFITEYVKIVHVDKGLVPFKLYDYQKDLVNSLHDNRFSIIKTARQCGKSTVSIAYLLHYILFNDNKTVGILANKAATSRELLGRLQLAYEKLPKWLQQGVSSWNKGDIELENGSKIIAAATSGSAVRGMSFSAIFLDEFAFVQSGIAEDFFRSVYPTISSGKETKVIIVSTPNGLNHFYKMWVEAEEGRSNFINFSVHWSQVPGRDEEWKRETIANTSEEQFEQEHEASFLGSSNTLINTNKLQQLVHKEPVLRSLGLNVYEETLENNQYIVCVDTAEGRGQDYSTISVINVTKYPMTQVAVYRSNSISPLLLPNIVNEVAMKYNMADVLIERDSAGAEVLNILNYDLEYENIIAMSGTKSDGFGVKMTKKVKSIGCSNLKDLIDNEKLVISDLDTISELASFVIKGKSFAAEDGCHDDVVMGLVLFSWFTSQDLFKDLTNKDIRNTIYAEQMKQIEDEMLPFGIFNNGEEDKDQYVKDGGELWQIV